MIGIKRDEFSEEVKRNVAARVNYRCSKPDCHAPTSGPQLDPAKALNVGVVAHITAASPGGPRYNPALSPEQRKHARNAIWLCQTCGKLVDNDQSMFTERQLRQWKEVAEKEAFDRIGKTATLVEPTQSNWSQEELELLAAAADSGEIFVHSSDEEGKWIRIGARVFNDRADPAVAATYLEALDSLCRRRLAKYDEGILYVLTGSGFKIARAMENRQLVDSAPTAQKYGQRTVDGWIRIFIKPTITTLDKVQPLLLKRNWTWDWERNELEKIHRIVEGSSDTQRQFLNSQYGLNLKGLIDDYNRGVDRLRESCRKLQEVIQDSPVAHELYRQTTSLESLQSLYADKADYAKYESRDVLLNWLFIGQYTESQHLAFLAGYMVNNRSELSFSETPQRFWNRHGAAFLNLLNDPFIHECYLEVNASGEELLLRARALKNSLEKIMDNLSLEYDVPLDRLV